MNFGIFGQFNGSCIEQANHFEWFGVGSPDQPPVAVLAPIADHDGLVMTNEDASNFAVHVYFDYFDSNHNGTDLALSSDGLHTGSTVTIGADVYPICDGEVLNWHFKKNNPDLSFVQVRHPSCGGRELIAYYGHIAPVTDLKKGSISSGVKLGTVMAYWTDSSSHLHLTLDTDTERDLLGRNYEVCDYVLSSPAVAVASVFNCLPTKANVKLAANKILLEIGFGRVEHQTLHRCRWKTIQAPTRVLHYRACDAAAWLHFYLRYDDHPASLIARNECTSFDRQWANDCVGLRLSHHRPRCAVEALRRGLAQQHAVADRGGGQGERQVRTFSPRDVAILRPRTLHDDRSTRPMRC